MTEAIIATALKTVGTTVGINFAFKCINLLSSTASGIYSVSQSVRTNGDPNSDIAKVLKETDIEFKVQVLEEFIKQIDLNKVNNDSLILCISGLNKCLQDIEKELKQIHDRLIYNKSLWLLSSIRSYSFRNNIIRINSHAKVLEERQNMLFKLISLPQQHDIFAPKTNILVTFESKFEQQ